MKAWNRKATLAVVLYAILIALMALLLILTNASAQPVDPAPCKNGSVWISHDTYPLCGPQVKLSGPRTIRVQDPGVWANVQADPWGSNVVVMIDREGRTLIYQLKENLPRPLTARQLQTTPTGEDELRFIFYDKGQYWVSLYGDRLEVIRE